MQPIVICAFVMVSATLAFPQDSARPDDSQTDPKIQTFLQPIPEFVNLCDYSCLTGQAHGEAKRTGQCPANGEIFRPRVGRSAKHEENGFGLEGKCEKFEVIRKEVLMPVDLIAFVFRSRELLLFACIALMPRPTSCPTRERPSTTFHVTRRPMNPSSRLPLAASK